MISSNGPDHLVVAGDQDPLGGLGQAPDLEAADQVQTLRLHEPLHALAQCPAGRESIVDPTAEEVLQAVAGAANGPGDRRAGCRIREVDQIEQGIEGGVAAADDEDTPAGVAIAMDAEDIGNAVEDAIGQLPLADGAARRRRRAGLGVAVVPEASITALASTRSWLPSGPCTVRENGASSRPSVFILSKPSRVTWITRVLRRNRERICRQSGERSQIALDQLAAGGIDVGVRLNPVAGRGQQLARGGIDHVAPGREEADMAPGQDVGAGSDPASKMMGSSPCASMASSL